MVRSFNFESRAPTSYCETDIYDYIKGGHWNVQEIVEKPSVYILAGSNDTILEKLCFVEERAQDIARLDAFLYGRPPRAPT